MDTSKQKQREKHSPFPRASTGIAGLDEITGGGLPKNSPTLVCGPAGSGKTVFGLQFALRGAAELDEPVVCFSFEESKEKIVRNIAALGFNAEKLEREGKLSINHLETSHEHDAEIGEFDLSGIFVRLDHAIGRIKAKRVVVDGAETLFGAFNNGAILRRELRRLFRWLDSKGVTSIITGEQGEGKITRHGFEEYLSDCVIFLDYRISDQLSTRRLRVVKYRGAPHSTDEYPFLIDERGISVLPLSTIGLNHSASDDRVSTGIKSLDTMFGGQGFFRGSSILVSGTAGTGKSSIAGTFLNAACERGEKGIYFAFEESRDQIIRNMKSIGLDLGRWVKKDRLCFETFRPTVFGLEAHLANIQAIANRVKPSVVVIDPITNFTTLGTPWEVKNMLMRLIDCLKTAQITAMFTSLTEGGGPVEQSTVGVSSLIDTWLLVRDIEMAGERNRGLYVLKSRGMAHSNQIREFVITDHGLELIPVYVGVDGNVFIGAARTARETEEAVNEKIMPQTNLLRDEVAKRRRRLFEAELAALGARFEAEEKERQAAEILAERREKWAARSAEKAHRQP